MAPSPPPQNQSPLIGPVFAGRRRAGPPGSARIDLIGELDLATAARARDALAAAQAASPSVICDLGDVSWIDASGVRVLLDAAAHARCTGGRLTFARCPASLPRLLGLLGLEGALEIEAPALFARSGARAARDGAPRRFGRRPAAL